MHKEGNYSEITAEQAEGFQIAGRTLNHYVRNRLAISVGYGELLSEHPNLPEDLQQIAKEIVQSSRDIEHILALVTGLNPITTRLKTDSPAGQPYIDLDDQLNPQQ